MKQQYDKTAGRYHKLSVGDSVMLWEHTPKNKKLLDWALELSEYDFHIQHIPTTKNQISDCLSRLAHIDYPSVAAVNTPDIPLPHTSVADWVRAQHDDIEISQCIHYLTQNRKDFDVTKLGQYKKHRKHLSLLASGMVTWKTRVVVPTVMRPQILQLSHDHPTSGHFGIERKHGHGETVVEITIISLLVILIDCPLLGVSGLAKTASQYFSRR